jgi:hypothetical protein
MADDGYTRRIFQWQAQILADSELTPLAVKIALALCRFINRQSRRAWPSQGTLAGLVHASRAGTQNALYQLTERGHLETTVNRGRGRSNTYRPTFRESEQQSENAYSSRHFNSEHAYASRQEVPTGVGTGVPTGVGTNYLNEELFEEPSEISPSMAAKNKAAADKDDFEEWYQLFPKHVARGAAYKAYKRARAQGASVEELKLGAMRYAAQVTGRDPKFTKHPATWLNAECWKDEPDEQPTSSGPETSVGAARAGGNGYAALKRRLG